MLWTDETVETLKTLAAQGRSASAIAAALGASSRNAVIGKANRIGIKLSGGGRRGHGAPKRVVPPLSRSKSLSGPCPSRPVGTARQTAPAPAAAPDILPALKLRFEEVSLDGCRWPVGDPNAGDFGYCGHPATNGRPYCAGHCRLAYRPASEIRRPRTASFTRVANSWRSA